MLEFQFVCISISVRSLDLPLSLSLVQFDNFHIGRTTDVLRCFYLLFVTVHARLSTGQTERESGGLD